MSEFATIIDEQGHEWTGLVVARHSRSWIYLLGVMLTGGLAGSSFREPDTVTVRLRGEDHRGRELTRPRSAAPFPIGSSRA